MKTILCFLGFHKWESYGFEKEPHEFIKAVYQNCKRCNKKRVVRYSEEDLDKMFKKFRKFRKFL